MKTVVEAFDKFVRNIVDLDPSKVEAAMESANSLLSNINEFDGQDGFFKLYSAVNIKFGSFARGTKCRELDDVDLMVGISANGTTYQANAPYDNIEMYVDGDQLQSSCMNEGTKILNSTKVINHFVKKLESTRDYCRSDIKKNQAAAVLNLLSKDWSFDIVPCFFTKPESDGRQYYLIPNGSGNWMKTDPTMDSKALENAASVFDGNLRRLIRLMKRWNRCKKIVTLQSYLLETAMLDLQITQSTGLDRVRMWYALGHLAKRIRGPIYDSKEIQGDLNKIKPMDRTTIYERALADQDVVREAVDEERAGNHELAINKWRIVFGEDFPSYG